MNMRIVIIGLVLTGLGVTGLVTGTEPESRAVLGGMVALSLYLVVLALLPGKRTVAADDPVEPATPASPAPEPEMPGNVREAAVVGFLGLLQEKGRLVDFLMDDITRHGDAQVGAAARVVHEGCRAALKEVATVEPVSGETEGSQVTVPADAASGDYRLVGHVSGEPPYSGTLVHKGWRATAVKLPREVKPDGTQLPAIAPAQVEMK